MLPYFQKSFAFNPPNQEKRPQNASASYDASDWSANGGPVQVGYSSWTNPISSWLGLAFEELGLRQLPSLLHGSLIGWSWLSQTLDPATQTRSSSEAFLWEALQETSNLIIYKSSLAKKILFDGLSAVGVIVESGGVSYTLDAKQEVILSAGVVRTTHVTFLEPRYNSACRCDHRRCSWCLASDLEKYWKA